MTLHQSNCFYHPDRVADAKCENCHKLICLSCKMKYRVMRGMESADDIYIYCPICYNERTVQAKKGGKFILLIFVFFLIVILGSFFLMFQFMSDWFNNIPKM